MEAVLDEDTAHPFRAVEKGVSRVVDVVPVGKIDVGGEELGLDDQKAA